MSPFYVQNILSINACRVKKDQWSSLCFSKVWWQNPYLNVLQSLDFDSFYQFTMELAGIGDRNLLKRYSMAMSTDFIPMSVLSESSQGHYSIDTVDVLRVVYYSFPVS